MYECVEHFGCLFDQVTLVILQLIIYRTMKPRVVTHIQHQTIVLRHYSNTVLGRFYSWSVWYPCFQPDFLTFSLHEKSPGMKLSLVPRPSPLDLGTRLYEARNLHVQRGLTPRQNLFWVALSHRKLPQHNSQQIMSGERGGETTHRGVYAE